VPEGKKGKWKGERKRVERMGSIKGDFAPPTKGARRPWSILAAR